MVLEVVYRKLRPVWKVHLDISAPHIAWMDACCETEKTFDLLHILSFSMNAVMLDPDVAARMVEQFCAVSYRGLCFHDRDPSSLPRTLRYCCHTPGPRSSFWIAPASRTSSMKIRRTTRLRKTSSITTRGCCTISWTTRPNQAFQLYLSVPMQSFLWFQGQSRFAPLPPCLAWFP